MRRRLTWLLSVILFALLAANVAPIAGPDHPPQAAAASPVTEFTIPTSNSSPIAITTGPDGNLWFTENSAGKIGRITSDGQITEFKIPGQFSSPQGITAGPDGNIWFADNADAIGRVTMQGMVTEFHLPSYDPNNPARNDPREITAGPDGNLWFTEFKGNKVGRITPQGAITEISVPTDNGGPDGIDVGPDGNIYFAEVLGHRIGLIPLPIPLQAPPSEWNLGDPSTWEALFECTNPTIVRWWKDLFGNRYFAYTCPKDNFTHITEPETVYPIIQGGNPGQDIFQSKASFQSSPADLTGGPDGNLWVSLEGDKIARVTPDGTVTEIGGITPASMPVGITSGPDNNIWFTEFKGNRIGRLDLSKVAPAPAPTIPGSSSRTFPETGKTVTGIFLDYWNNHGGLAQQGYPISDLIQERSDTDGKTYTVQYFERAVFEYHPENPAPNNILLSLLGDFAYKQKYPNGAPNQTPNTSPGSVLFSQTGHRLGGKFLAYWNSHGGLAQQGYPISDEFQEKSGLDGKIYTVQYFERAVFEYHPENAGTPYEVLLSQLGTTRYKANYPGH